ncbi:MFS transporter [Hymenobacter sp. CRA2]|uniref:MFS transporter n=1 Tax=Hymenobacter sp. CRA2 TaxID=1955620 RepID=UPI00098F7FE9|nr:MFS transporter [Hymenobacter sp. CRA2]OON70941.1 hypothetical protein B0919_02750 [Hymenobacter sp. CRA2]
MDASQSVFKSWAPEWLVRTALFAALLPSVALLGLYMGSPADAAGYYGIEPADVQFSVLVYYAGLAAFFPLDPRFSSYFAPRQYFLVCLLLLIGSVWLCTFVHQLPLFLFIRFCQGLVAGAIGSPCLTLIFARLDSARARAMGYTVFYGIFLAAGPLTTALSGLALEHFNFQMLYSLYMLLELPGGLLLVLLLNNVRLKKRVPLYQLDWPSFVLLALALELLAYCAAYGQQLYWLQDTGIGLAVLGAGVFGGLFVLRQRHQKRPYINLSVFRYRNFRLGLGVFFVFYLCRGTSSIATSYFVTVLRLDAAHLALLQLATLLGLVLAMSLAVRFVLVGTPMRRIWLTGFGLLLLYHGWMYFLFGPGQSVEAFFVPMFVQGLGTGALMVPITVFTLSSLPANISVSGSFMAVITRFLAFSTSMALVSFFQLLWRADNQNRFAQEATATNGLLTTRLQGYQQTLQGKGLALETAQHAAVKLLAGATEVQAQLRYAMSYYGMVSVALMGLLVLLLLMPHLRQGMLSFRQRPL